MTRPKHTSTRGRARRDETAAEAPPVGAASSDQGGALPGRLSEVDLLRLRLAFSEQGRHETLLRALTAEHRAARLELDAALAARAELELELVERYQVTPPLKVTQDGRIARGG